MFYIEMQFLEITSRRQPYHRNVIKHLHRVFSFRFLQPISFIIAIIIVVIVVVRGRERILYSAVYTHHPIQNRGHEIIHGNVAPPNGTRGSTTDDRQNEC